jgi:hypothetical protein
MKKPSAKKQFWVAVVWVIFSAVWLDATASKVLDLRAAGRVVSGWRMAQAGFWIVMLPFFVWQALTSWKAWRSESVAGTEISGGQKG